MIACHELIEAMLESFRGQASVRPYRDDCVVILPYLTAEATQVEIWVSERNGTISLSDDGVTLGQLFLSGVTVEGNKKLEGMVQQMVNVHGVNQDGSSITVQTDLADVGDALLRLANAVVAVSQLHTHRAYRARTEFATEVKRLLAMNEVTYDAGFTLRGRTGVQTIPIYINSNINMLLEPLTATSLNRARELSRLTAFKWLDLQYKYQDDYKYDVIVNDGSPEFSAFWEDPAVMDPLATHSTQVFRWSLDRTTLLSKLSSRE